MIITGEDAERRGWSGSLKVLFGHVPEELAPSHVGRLLPDLLHIVRVQLELPDHAHHFDLTVRFAVPAVRFDQKLEYGH